MKQITIDGEPYLYERATSRALLIHTLDRSRTSIIEPGEYILLDRHFNLYTTTEAQMDKYISDDYIRWRRVLPAKTGEAK